MQANDKKIFQASLLVAVSGILYGFLGLLGTALLQENMSIACMLFWRFFTAGIWMLLFVINPFSTSKRNNLDKQSIAFMCFLGAIGYAGSSAFYFLASHYTGTGLAMVIFFSYPIMIAITLWLTQQQSINKLTFCTLAAMILGLMLLKESSQQPLNSLGLFFGVIAAASYAFYVMGSKRIASIKIDSNILTMMVCFSSAIIFLLSSLFEHNFSVPHAFKSWLLAMALGIFATAVPIQLMLEGLKHISSIRASIISVLEPLVTVFVGILVLHESISHIQMLGALIILASALIVQFQRKL